MIFFDSNNMKELLGSTDSAPAKRRPDRKQQADVFKDNKERHLHADDPDRLLNPERVDTSEEYLQTMQHYVEKQTEYASGILLNLDQHIREPHMTEQVYQAHRQQLMGIAAYLHTLQAHAETTLPGSPDRDSAIQRIDTVAQTITNSIQGFDETMQGLTKQREYLKDTKTRAEKRAEQPKDLDNRISKWAAIDARREALDQEVENFVTKPKGMERVRRGAAKLWSRIFG